MAQATDLILVDGSSYLYRAYFAAKTGFSTKSGFPTGATFIITRMLRNLVHDYPNHKILMTFDAHGKCFRQDMYPEYKSNRPPMPEDLAVQIPTIHHIVAAMGFPVVSLPGVEADDVLGSYAKVASSQGLKVLICTGDKDLAQLVDDNVQLKDTMKDIVYNREEVIKKYGVPPEMIIDFLALKGDASDNIPGMKGVGDVTALYLLNNIGGVYTIKDNLDKVQELNFRGKGTFGKRFLEQWPMIELSYKLATIKCDVPLPIPIEEIQLPQENNEVLIALFEHLEFHRFASEQRAKKAAFDDLLANVHGKDAQGTKLQQPKIIGLKLAPLVFTIPKGENVTEGEIADPNDRTQSSSSQDASVSTAQSNTTAPAPTSAATSAAPTRAVTTTAPTSTVTPTSPTTSAELTKSSVTSSSSSITNTASATHTSNTGSASNADTNTQAGTASTAGTGTVVSAISKWLTPSTAQATTSTADDETADTANADNAASSNEPNQSESSRLSARPALGDGVRDNGAGGLLELIENATDPDIMEKIRFARALDEEKKPKRKRKSKAQSAQATSATGSTTEATAATLTSSSAATINATLPDQAQVNTAATHTVATPNAPVSATPAANANLAAPSDMPERDEFATDEVLDEELEDAGLIANNNGVEHEELLAVLKNRKPNDNISLFESGFHLVTTDEQLNELIEHLSHCERFAFSTACNLSQPSMCELIGLSFTLSESESYYIPLRHSYVGAPSQLNVSETLAKLQPIFNSDKITKVAHDLKQHRLKLHFSGLEMSGPMLDSMILCHLLDSSQTIDLDNLADRYNHYNSLRYDASFDYWVPCANIEVEKALRKECERSLMPYRLLNTALQELPENYAKLKGPELLQFEMQVLEVLYDMERIGALVDARTLKQISKEFKQELQDIKDQIYDEAGEAFRITSPRILGITLFEKMRIPYPKKTTKVDKNGHLSYSTSEEILTELTQYPIAGMILHYRTLSKLITTYSDKLPLLISPRTKRIHTNFNLAGTITGRLSSSDPNLQNIPTRTEDGNRIREAFIANPGYSIVSADYSQIELRIIAHLSQDSNLKQAFLNGQDIHKVTAAEVLGKPIDEVTEIERSHAKSTNYGLMYGMSFKGLAKQTGMDAADAKEYITNYFKKYPNIKEYMEKIKRYATKYGYVTSLTGRKVYIKGIKSTGLAYRQACRAAINAPMQSGAADIIKSAMVEVYAYIKTLEPGAVNLTLQEHDELVFEVKDTILDEFCKKIKEIMTTSYTIDVPLEVDIAVGKSWGKAHTVHTA